MKPTCHPDRKHRALGLCNACYLKQNGGSAVWYLRNKDITKKRAKKWAKENSERKKEISRLWANKEYKKNPQKFIAAHQKQLDTKVEFRIAHNLRCRLRSALQGRNKSRRTLQLLGCSIEKLKAHLQKQFKAGMTWRNYGRWHIDHKKPCVLFNLEKASEQRKCFHYTNLQPLWAFENQSKGGR